MRDKIFNFIISLKTLAILSIIITIGGIIRVRYGYSVVLSIGSALLLVFALFFIGFGIRNNIKRLINWLKRSNNGRGI